MPEYYSEKDLEPKLRKEIEARGGKAYKWVSPGNRGVPDRIVFMPNGKVYLVELKSTGEVPSKIQLYVHGVLRRLGLKVYVIDNLPDLLNFIDEVSAA